MKKITKIFLALFAFIFVNLIRINKLCAMGLKQISIHKFNKLQHITEIPSSFDDLKYPIFYYVISISFILLMIIVSIYLFKNQKQLRNAIIFIWLILVSTIFIGFFNIFQPDAKINKVLHNVVSTLENKTLLEQDNLLSKYEENDYGFNIENLKLDNNLLENNKSYYLSFSVNFSSPLNLFATSHKKYYIYTFKYNGKKSIKINYTNNFATPTKVVKSSDPKINQYDDYCFTEKQLSWFNSSNTSLVSKDKNGKLSHVKFEYVELYSNKNNNIYCGSIYTKRTPYIMYDNNKVANLVEVK